MLDYKQTRERTTPVAKPVRTVGTDYDAAVYNLIDYLRKQSHLDVVQELKPTEWVSALLEKERRPLG